MSDELRDALQEVPIGFRLHVERRRAERRRAQPRPRLAARHGLVEQVAGRRGPARRGELAPLVPLPFRQIRGGVARHGGRRDAVALNAEPRATGARPLAQRRDEPLVEQFRQRAAPVLADHRALRAAIGRQHRQQRRDVVSAPLPETRRRNPATSPSRTPRGCRRRWQTAGGPQTAPAAARPPGPNTGQRAAVVVAQHVPFAAERRTLHLHPGPARDEEPHLPRVGRRRQVSRRLRRRATRSGASTPG